MEWNHIVVKVFLLHEIVCFNLDYTTLVAAFENWKEVTGCFIKLCLKEENYTSRRNSGFFLAKGLVNVLHIANFTRSENLISKQSKVRH